MKNEAQTYLALQRAKNTNNLGPLLNPWYMFRAYVKFKHHIKHPKTGDKMLNNHFFGYENKVSYSQCINGHADKILMDRLRGFTYCIQLCEQKFKGTYAYASIYQRDTFPDGKFNTLIRRYNTSGEIEEQQDPVITEENNITLYFNIADGLLQITTEPVILPDFKQLVKKHL